MSASPANSPRRSATNRASRPGFRIDAETKELIEWAAEVERRSMTDYCLSVLVEASRATVERNQQFELSERNWEIFFDTLMHPPEPNERLLRAVAETQAQVLFE